MEHGKAATVHREPDPGDRHAAEIAQALDDHPLEGMPGLPVADRREPMEPAGEQKPGMLARTIVVEGGRPVSGRDERARGRLVHRHVRPAGQVGGREPAAIQNPRGHPHVPRLAPVGRAEERDLVAAEPESLLSSRLEQRHRLEGLCGGAQVDPVPGRARAGDEASVLVHDRHAAAVDRFHPVAPPDAGENRRRAHRRASITGARGGP